MPRRCLNQTQIFTVSHPPQLAPTLALRSSPHPANPFCQVDQAPAPTKESTNLHAPLAPNRAEIPLPAKLDLQDESITRHAKNAAPHADPTSDSPNAENAAPDSPNTLHFHRPPHASSNTPPDTAVEISPTLHRPSNRTSTLYSTATKPEPACPESTWTENSAKHPDKTPRLDLSHAAASPPGLADFPQAEAMDMLRSESWMTPHLQIHNTHRITTKRPNKPNNSPPPKKSGV